jgi:hypothetical protein
MKANTTTNKGIYLGTGINPFPALHAFATVTSGANKTFLNSLNGVVEVSKEEFGKKEESLNNAKEQFFQAFPA